MAGGLRTRSLPEAVAKIHELSGGVPRDILSLCQQAYDRAVDSGRQTVNPADVEEAFGVLQITDPEPELEAVV